MNSTVRIWVLWIAIVLTSVLTYQNCSKPTPAASTAETGVQTRGPSQPSVVITQQPASQTVATGDSVSFQVNYTDDLPSAIQWYNSHGTIAGASESIFTIASAQANDQDTYYAVISDFNGQVQSDSATLTVNAAPPSLCAEAPKLQPMVSIGEGYSCVLLNSGSVECWGLNNAGELGNGAMTTSMVPVPVKEIASATELGTGYHHSCVLLASGQVWCWGLNGSGELGDGTTTNRSAPVRVKGVTDAVRISVGHHETCAILKDGRLLCWGQGHSGDLGDGQNSSSSVPVEVKGISAPVDVSVMDGHVCALLSNESMQCWGSNYYGQLGNNSSTPSNVPVDVLNVKNVEAISTGFNHSCALQKTGQIQCWGDNADGELGAGLTATQSLTPVTVKGITNAVTINARDRQDCVILSDATMDCWGDNSTGELGDGSTKTSDIPVAVKGLSHVIAIGGGPYHTCAIQNSGVVKCWGSNADGGLGNGSTKDSSLPVQVLGLNACPEKAQ